MTRLHSLEETAALITSGKQLLLAGDEEILMRLPRGNWVAGTSPYFMTAEGRLMSTDRISVCVLPPAVREITTRFYGSPDIRNIAADAPYHGFTFLIIPGFSSLLPEFAQNVQDYPGIYNNPLFGWVSGVALEKKDTVTPKVIDGLTGEASSQQALALHASLTEGIVAEIGSINLFTQGTGDIITVEETGYTFKEVLVNGTPANLAEYLRQHDADLSQPLVADYLGAMINVSIKKVDQERGLTKFYAPLFPNVEYRLAAPIDDFGAAMEREMRKIPGEPTIVINCILNCLYNQVETVARLPGPISFGEIAYGLLNQTLVYMVLSSR